MVRMTIIRGANIQEYGITGPVVFSLYISVSAAIFAFILLEMRIKAPGAKTYPQIVRSRFGKAAHITMVAIFMAADVTNYLVITMNGLDTMLAVSVEPNRARLIVYLFIAICSFVAASQLGSFRVLMATIAVFILGYCSFLMFSIFHNSAQYPLGTIDRFYKLLACFNETMAYTGLSPLYSGGHASVYAAILTSAIVWSQFLVCQANWSVGIALTPNHSSVGFVLASFAIFSVPFVLSTCLGLGYLAISSSLRIDPLMVMNGQYGMLPYVVPIKLFGRGGMVMTYILVAVLTIVSCARSVLGLGSLIVYDVLEVYLKPFKRNLGPNVCVFCEKHRGCFSDSKSSCQCCSMLECTQCNKDNQFMDMYKRRWNYPYTCKTHGGYRGYRERIRQCTSAMLAFILALSMPIASLVDGVSNLQIWLNIAHTVITGPMSGCLILTLFWARLTRGGLLHGTLGTMLISVLTVLVYALESRGDFGEVLQDTWLLVAAIGIVGGFFVPTLWSGMRAPHLSAEEELTVWASLQNIDNPLTPWPELYSHELDLRYSPRLSEGKVGLAEVRRSLQLTRKITKVGLALAFVWYMLFWPLLTFSSKYLTFDGFFIWEFLIKHGSRITAIEAWNVLALLCCLLMPIRVTLFKLFRSSKSEGYVHLKPERLLPKRHAKDSSPVSFDIFTADIPFLSLKPK
ncbi:unnamed protein product [Dibothriocephalus latus]|uniref:Uncharacterized protein n=1 Tax=Dibothriocephalus latus TaxID=60516 RepID=A0A3P6T0Q8_DIBLA|nr:unnamed protein product [Dibothriocephalus latus]